MTRSTLGNLPFFRYATIIDPAKILLYQTNGVFHLIRMHDNNVLVYFRTKVYEKTVYLLVSCRFILDNSIITYEVCVKYIYKELRRCALLY